MKLNSIKHQLNGLLNSNLKWNHNSSLFFSGEQLTLNANLSKKKKKKKAQQNIRSHPPTWILPEIIAIVAGIAPLFFTIFSTSLATLCRKKIQR